jgi:hypothetical protein
MKKQPWMLRIPLPRQPAWLTRALDAYSGWAEVPTGPTLRIGSWRYQVLRMDWVSVVNLIAVAAGYGWWTNSYMGAVLGAVCGIVAWVYIEYISKPPPE